MLCCKKYKSKHKNESNVEFPAGGFPMDISDVTNSITNIKIENVETISSVPSSELDDTAEKIKTNRGRVLGEYRYKNGDVYRGYWINGLRHGKGMLIKQNGDSYEGDWEKGIRSGYGIERYVNGTVYMGNFVNGIRYGYGEIQMKDKSIYEGTFDDGIVGYGKIVWTNGEEYIGDVLNGYKHGYGRTTYKGKEIKGYYQNGQYIP